MPSNDLQGCRRTTCRPAQEAALLVAQLFRWRGWHLHADCWLSFGTSEFFHKWSAVEAAISRHATCSDAVYTEKRRPWRKHMAMMVRL